MASEEVNKPYYRIVCPACFGNNNGDPLGPGSYWTPRWDAILAMAQTIFRFWISSGREKGPSFYVRIFELNHAILDNAPEEHRWAFRYDSDAGEKILVKALEAPKLIFDGDVSSSDFLDLVDRSSSREQITDYGRGEKFLWQGKEVFVLPNYSERCLEVAEQNADGWSFSVIGLLKNMDSFRIFLGEAIPQTSKEDDTALLDYAVSDFGWLT